MNKRAFLRNLLTGAVVAAPVAAASAKPAPTLSVTVDTSQLNELMFAMKQLRMDEIRDHVIPEINRALEENIQGVSQKWAEILKRNA